MVYAERASMRILKREEVNVRPTKGLLRSNPFL
jgi:hypothetical protein